MTPVLLLALAALPQGPGELPARDARRPVVPRSVARPSFADSTRIAVDPGGEQVFCVQVPSFPDGPLERVELRPREGSPGRWLGRPDARHVCVFWSPERGLEEVVLPPGATSAARTRPLADQAPARGELRVRLAGAPTRGDCSLTVLARLSRVRLARLNRVVRDPDRSCWDVELPPGSYRIRVEEGTEPPPGLCSLGGALTAQGRNHFEFSAVEFDAEVVAGTSRWIRRAWPRGERGRVRVEAPGAGHADLWFLADDGKPTAPLTFARADSDGNGTSHAQLPPGVWREVLHPLAAGHHRLLVGAEGFESRVLEFDVVSGRTFDIDVELLPRR